MQSDLAFTQPPFMRHGEFRPVVSLGCVALRAAELSERCSGENSRRSVEKEKEAMTNRVSRVRERLRRCRILPPCPRHVSILARFKNYGYGVRQFLWEYSINR